MGWVWIVGAVVGWFLAGQFITGPLDVFLLNTFVKQSKAGYYRRSSGSGRSYPGVIMDESYFARRAYPGVVDIG